ncbi:hypothetical protein JS562_55350, partial [Agrobacterium sp. S2]|nr:hypothetical protein [Agrobacterium sp. S2]
TTSASCCSAPQGSDTVTEGLALVADLHGTDDVAARGWVHPRRRPSSGEARRAARSTFAVLNLLLVQPLNDLHPDSNPSAELHAHIAQIVRGYEVSTRTVSSGSGGAPPAGSD